MRSIFTQTKGRRSDGNAWQQCPEQCPIDPLCALKDRHVHHNIDKEEREREKRGGHLRVYVCVLVKIATGGYRSSTHTPPAYLEKLPLSAPWTEAALTAGHFLVVEVKSPGSQSLSPGQLTQLNGQTLFLCRPPLVSHLISSLSTRTQRATWWIFKVSVLGAWRQEKGRRRRLFTFSTNQTNIEQRSSHPAEDKATGKCERVWSQSANSVDYQFFFVFFFNFS